MNRDGVKEKEIVIYLGTHKLVALAGEVGDGEPRIIRHAEIVNPDGFENGLVTNLERAAASLEALVDSLFSAKDSYGVESPRRDVSDIFTYVVLGNVKLKTYRFSSSQYFQGLRRTISSHEIRSVVSQTRSVATLPLSEFVLQAIPETFLVDDTANVTNPLGLEAHRLGVTLKIFTMDFQAFRNISKTFEAAEGTAEYGKCVDISTKAALREMILPGVLPVAVPVVVGFVMHAEALGGLLAGVTASGVLMAIFQSNAGGAWDNAKKTFEAGVEINGKMYYKGSDPHKAAVVGDTVGDPFKDTSGPSINILIKLMSIVALIIAPLIAIPTMDTQPTSSKEEIKIEKTITQEGENKIVENVEVKKIKDENGNVTVTTTKNGVTTVTTEKSVENKN